MMEPRRIAVRFAVPGLGMLTETYDRLSVEDCVCHELNTAPPNMQLNVRPVDHIPEDRPAMISALTFVAGLARADLSRYQKIKRGG